MAKLFESGEDWETRKDRIIGLGDRSFHKSYYPQLRQNLDRLERFRTLIDHTSDFVILIALPEGIVVDANAALGHLLGESVEKLIGQPLASLELLDVTILLADLRLDMSALNTSVETPPHFLVTEYGCGEASIWLELSYRVAMVEHVCYGVLVGRDFTEHKLAQDRIKFLVHHDVLTGLPNVLLVQDRLQQAISLADRNHEKLALLVVDLDQFKTVNDTLGRRVGDQVLITAANRLRECLQGTDTLCRQGGDEFLILLPNLNDPDASVIVLSKLMLGFLMPLRVDDKELTMTVSVGVSMYPDDGADFDTLLKKADMAMYRAKHDGGNTYRFFNQEMNEEAQERLVMHVGLRQALEKGEFVLHYQPQIELDSGHLVGVEALIRWNHPELGLVPPARFIPAAEENGLIVPIGAWVLREACREAVRFQNAGLSRLVVAVNLSALQFKRGDIAQSVRLALEESGLAPELLELELTESILIGDTERVLSTVMGLKEMGVKLSIDDFGTGYSSLAYLKRFKVDKLKIDQSFIRDLAHDVEDEAIVRAVIQMAHSLGLQTIAEGVENKEVLDRLKLYHCDEIQGYFISRPIPATEFVTAYAPSHSR
ncbi:EAL domain-containing protein [Rhodoferax sp.]|uniref:putative bifunctional diguanylate cyclase/phosphodiesterase n=1 Tax=Rhodoferax sp. TaxID=50421 RepID=UPI00283FE82D|nr:EAL domain-containing protein [Rhodoferax sp.]MDR3368259.1 EAL domain-containing protein [Rhodoferax sp.]